MTVHQKLRSFVGTTLAAAMAIASTTGLAASSDTRYLTLAPYSEELGGLSIAFLARDLETGRDYVLEGSDLDTRRAPWSTFKIPNLLIALETGVAPSLEAWRDWEPARRPAAEHWPDVWKEGQTLGTAFGRSSVWYFQDLALEVGGQSYRDRLSEWGYGNTEVPDGSDDFWLGGSLRISVREQVDFLQGLLSDEFAVSPAAIEALDTASKAGEASSQSLHGKTGSGPDNPMNVDGRFSGWYVGYLRRDDRAPVVFALHVSAPSFSALRDFRRPFAVRLLGDAGLASPNVLQAN